VGCPAHVGAGAAAAAPSPAPPPGCPAHAASPARPAATQARLPRFRLALDTDLCQGHAVCVGDAPELFRIGADGKVEAKLPELADTLVEQARSAARYCPTRAIRVLPNDAS
jgi:sterol 14-demethylase